MTAATVAKALRGRKVGSTWMARCPADDDRTPSLSIRDGDNGEPIVHCFSGCDWRDDQIDGEALDQIRADAAEKVSRQVIPVEPMPAKPRSPWTAS